MKTWEIGVSIVMAAAVVAVIIFGLAAGGAHI
jgi:hypothetical protein